MDCSQCPTHDGDLFRGSSFERRLVRKLVRDDRGLVNVSEGRKYRHSWAAAGVMMTWVCMHENVRLSWSKALNNAYVPSVPATISVL